MKKALLTIAVLAIIACVLFVAYALLNMHAYYNLVDGTAGHYSRLHNRMTISFVIGIVLAVVGTACIIIRSKI